MLNLTSNAGANIATGEKPEGTAQKISKTILLLDGCFLLVVGLVAAFAEFMSHFWGSGLHGTRFLTSPYTIGFFEAHGLAVLMGVLLIRATKRDGVERQFWHSLAVAIHLLLGGSNLLYWLSFVALDFVAQGVVTTVAHGLFIVLNLVCLLQLRNLVRIPGGKG
jgi:hypothetical protein